MRARIVAVLSAGKRESVELDVEANSKVGDLKEVFCKKFSSKYHSILERFRDLTGIGCFLNTSFNLSGEPIVNSPKDAYHSFSKSKIDTLVLENFVVTKDASKE